MILLCDEETPEGTIRCQTASPESVMELSVVGDDVRRRFVKPDGEPNGHQGQWVAISADDIQAYYNWPNLRAWFLRHGFTQEIIRERKAAEQEAKHAWKKTLKRK